MASRLASLLLALVVVGCVSPAATRDPRFSPGAHWGDLHSVAEWLGSKTGHDVLVACSKRTLNDVTPSLLDDDPFVGFARGEGLMITHLPPRTILLEPKPSMDAGELASGRLRSILEQLAERGEAGVLLPEVLDVKVGGARPGERWSQAFERLATENGLVAARFGAVIALSRSEISGGSPLDDPESPRAIFERLAPRLPDGEVSLDVRGANFGLVLLEIARQAGWKVRLDATVDVPVTLHVAGASARVILRYLVWLGELHSSLESGVLRLSRHRARPRGWISLKNASAAGAARFLARAAGSDRRPDLRAGGTFTCELRDTDPLDALRAVEAVSASSKRLADLEAREDKLEGTCSTSSGRFALVSGRVLACGERAFDGTLVAVKVVQVEVRSDPDEHGRTESRWPSIWGWY